MQHSVRPGFHAGGALDEWLYYNTSAVVRGERAEFFHVAHEGHGQSEPAEAVVENRHAAERGRAHGIAVVGVIERDEARAFRLSALLAELERHFHGTLHCGGAVVGEEDARQRAGGPERNEFRGEENGRLVGESERGDVGDAIQLLFDGRDDARMPVTVDVRPDGGVAVYIFPPVLISQQRAAAAGDEQRLMLRRAPVLHLREGMPEVRLVEAEEVGGGKHMAREESRGRLARQMFARWRGFWFAMPGAAYTIRAFPSETLTTWDNMNGWS